MNLLVFIHLYWCDLRSQYDLWPPNRREHILTFVDTGLVIYDSILCEHVISSSKYLIPALNVTSINLDFHDIHNDRALIKGCNETMIEELLEADLLESRLTTT